MMSHECPLRGRLDLASVELQEDGPSYMRQVNLMKDIAQRPGENRAACEPKRGKGSISWGKKAHLGDFEMQQVAIGKLHSRAIDTGDTIRLSAKSRVSLEHIEPVEKNQCVLLHTVADTQRSREGGG